MNKHETITIMEVGNGYVVTPACDSNMCTESSRGHVFETLPNLIEFVRHHFWADEVTDEEVGDTAWAPETNCAPERSAETRYTITTTDRTEMLRAMKSIDMYCVLTQLENELRQDWKYNDNKDKGEHWHDVLRELLEDYNVNLEDL